MVKPLGHYRLDRVSRDRPHFGKFHERYAVAVSHHAASLSQMATVDERGREHRQIHPDVVPRVRWRRTGDPRSARCNRSPRHLDLRLVRIRPRLHRQRDVIQCGPRGSLEYAVEIARSCALGVEQLPEQAHPGCIRSRGRDGE